MSVFAISDLHLPGGDKKPMDIFGPHWANHFERIQADWSARVAPEDTVLLAGDISWAMRLEAAQADLDAIGALPGRKVILRGNHDYWWSSITRLRDILPEGMYALQNDALMLDDILICGTRGWLAPESPQFDDNDARIFARELIRLELSLEQAAKLYEQKMQEGIRPWWIVMVHYPPLADKGLPTEVTELIGSFPVDDVVYGHLHGPGLAGAYNGTLEGVRYHLTSCDGLDFKLLELEDPRQ